jgi:phosphate transport system protein
MLSFRKDFARYITYFTLMICSAKYIERFGDHATNIAETIYYMATGAQPEGERPKDDTANTVGAVTE